MREGGHEERERDRDTDTERRGERERKLKVTKWEGEVGQGAQQDGAPPEQSRRAPDDGELPLCNGRADDRTDGALCSRTDGDRGEREPAFFILCTDGPPQRHHPPVRCRSYRPILPAPVLLSRVGSVALDSRWELP
jgi:hypothetical protein